MSVKKAWFWVILILLACAIPGCNTRIGGLGFYWQSSIWSCLLALVIYLIACHYIILPFVFLWKSLTYSYKVSESGGNLSRYWLFVFRYLLIFLIVTWLVGVSLLQLLPSSPTGLPLLPSWFATSGESSRPNATTDSPLIELAQKLQSWKQEQAKLNTLQEKLESDKLTVVKRICGLGISFCSGTQGKSSSSSY